MGYFASFMLLHLHLRHKFTSTGNAIVDVAWSLTVRMAVLGLALIVCYSRYEYSLLQGSFLTCSCRFYLGYHTVDQIVWGFLIGTCVGSVYYYITEYLPFFHPNSHLGGLRRRFLNSPVFTWLRVKDGWAVWQDGGHEEIYQHWRHLWESKDQKRE